MKKESCFLYEWKNPRLSGINRLPPRTTFIPFEDITRAEERFRGASIMYYAAEQYMEIQSNTASMPATQKKRTTEDVAENGIRRCKYAKGRAITEAERRTESEQSPSFLQYLYCSFSTASLLKGKVYIKKIGELRNFCPQ